VALFEPTDRLMNLVGPLQLPILDLSLESLEVLQQPPFLLLSDGPLFL